jgi:hypothetical protein
MQCDVLTFQLDGKNAGQMLLDDKDPDLHQKGVGA